MYVSKNLILFMLVYLMALPIITLVFGLTFRYAKNFNSMDFGYKTKKSMRSIEAFKDANDFAGKAFIISSVITLVITLIAYIFVIRLDDAFIFLDALFIMTLFEDLGMIIPIILTEESLRKRFKKEEKNT